MHVHTIPVGGYNVFLRQNDGRLGKNILFIHGVGASGRYWLPLVNQLTSDNLYIPDLPGYGKSSRSHAPLTLKDYAALTAELIHVLHLNDVVLVGNSYGCQILLEYLHRYGQDKVKQLALIGPTVDMAERRLPTQIVRVIQDIPRESIKTLTILTWDYLRARPKQFVQSSQDAVNDRPEEKLSTLLLPTLVIRGEKDGLVSETWAEHITRLLPQGTLAVIPGSSHVTHSTSSSQTADVLRTFIAEN